MNILSKKEISGKRGTVTFAVTLGITGNNALVHNIYCHNIYYQANGTVATGIFMSELPIQLRFNLSAPHYTENAHVVVV